MAATRSDVDWGGLATYAGFLAATAPCPVAVLAAVARADSARIRSMLAAGATDGQVWLGAGRVVEQAMTGELAGVEALQSAPEPIIAAQAMLLLARSKNAAGDFAGAAELAERGLLHTQPFLRRVEVEAEIRPALHATLADDVLAEEASAYDVLAEEGLAAETRAGVARRVVG